MKNKEVAWWFAMLVFGVCMVIASSQEGVRLVGWIIATFTAWHFMNEFLNVLRPAGAADKDKSVG